MTANISEKIVRINKATIDSFHQTDVLEILKKFVDAGLSVLGADFGVVDLKPKHSGVEGVTYKSANTPEEVKEYYPNKLIIPVNYNNKKLGEMSFYFKRSKKTSISQQNLSLILGNSVAQALVIHNLNCDIKDFNNTLDNTLDSIFIFDADTLQMGYTNQGATILTGLTRSAIMKKTLHEIISGLSPVELEDKLSVILEHPDLKYQTFESTLTNQAGKKIPVEISLQFISQKNNPERFLAIVRDITERKQTENTILKLAYYDSLTGLPNRTLLNERIKEAQTQAQKNKNMYALFFVDLDRFKVINDIYGHQIGDLLLNQVAKRMQKLIPKKATLARMGGDEFLVLLPNIDTVEEAEKCAVNIQEVFSEFFEINDQEIYSNGSIGFAIFPLDGIDHSTLLKNADLALNRAKEHGGGNIQQYRTGLPLFYTMQPKLQSQLREAIKKDQLILHFQPIVSLKNKKIIGCEALVRWNHPEMGLLYPGSFIGQAEESGLIVELGEWVLESVCKQVKQWEKDGKSVPSVSINISPRELLKPTLVARMDACLKKYKVSASQIKIELTETFLMKNIDLSISILEQLRGLGLKILIDDFGTGYASLNYLKKLPISAVKIDKTFTQGVPANLQDAALTSAIIAIAHQLNLDVVGEGVENQDQYDFLSAAKCNYVQGIFVHKPMPAEEFAKLLNLS